MLYSLLKLGTWTSPLRVSINAFSTAIYRASDGALNLREVQQSILQAVITDDDGESRIARWCKGGEGHLDGKKSALGSGGENHVHTANCKETDGVALDAKPSAQSAFQSQYHDFELNRQFFSSDSALAQSTNTQEFTKAPSVALPAENTWAKVQCRKYLADTQQVQEAQKRISRLLESDDTPGLLKEVWNATQNEAVIASIPSATFVEILRQLDPYDDFLPFRDGYKERIPKHYSMLTPYNVMRYNKLQRRRIMYWDICQRRIQVGRALTIGEYRYLLRCTRGTWDGRTASRIMKDMIASGIRPDLACYNYYFEAKCWSDSWYPEERQRLRVFPYAQKRREQTSELRIRPNVVLNPHNVGQDGLKAEVTRIFTHMVEGGTVADSKAYGHLITALAREGDLQGVKAVLKRTWDVDADAINKKQDAKLGPRLCRSSPLYPDQNLLFIVAHAFSSNNDVSTALKLVDHFSRKFSIPITQDICTELLEWAFILSTPRYKKRREDGAHLGQLSVQTVENLWKVLLSGPYCCEPSLPMYDFLIRSLRRRDRLLPMLRYMLKAYEIHVKDVQEYCKHPSRAKNLQNGEASVDFDSATHSIGQKSKDLGDKAFMSFVTLHNWFALLLNGRKFLSREARVYFWQRQLLPDVIDVFWRFRDRKGVEYPMKTGKVLLRESRERRSMYYLRGLERAASRRRR